ncbi:tRNA modification GTPase MnmE [Clostridiales bacterium CHKCI001]|nr:tRNA modification GTPase MnmE [Clostridiales bacterium CHKCI001]
MANLNQIPSGNRVHIGFFGKRNAGKSSVVNAVTGQNLAIVSDTKGTTTDPVQKAMELLPIGPVVIIDTPGIDDEGELGALRVKRTKQVLNKTDVAVLIVDAQLGIMPEDQELIQLFEQKQLPYIVVYNKSDLADLTEKMEKDTFIQNKIAVSALTKENIYELKEMIGRLAVKEKPHFPIVQDLIERGDFVVLVIPIDAAAPKGRLILPQQQTIREILESGAVAVVCQPTELKETLAGLSKKPKLVITDSQAFGQVSQMTPDDILLTSFSILFARHKGNLEQAVKGAVAIETLKDGDAVLISEGCTHHRQCGDIGTEKLPAWIQNYTKKKLNFAFSSGTEFPEDVTSYSMIVHCGGCMLNEKEMKYRQQSAMDQQIPITNYGIMIAYIHGILKRSLKVFPDIEKYLL